VESHPTNDPPAVETATPETKTADPSPAPVGDKPDAKTEPKADETIADVTRNVLDESRKRLAKADPASTPDAKAKTEKPAEGDAKAEPAKAESKAEPEPPFHKHPRWIDLNGKYKTAKEQVSTLETQLGELKPLAEMGKSVQDFMAENHLSAEEFKYGQGIMALMKHAPDKALEALEDLREQLMVHLGKALPADLQERVDAGEISEAAAKELLAAKRTGESAQAKAERLEADSRKGQQEQETKAVKTATDEWWAALKARDPDLGKIDTMVVDRLTSLVAQHRATVKTPITPKIAVEMCQKAYDDVKAKLKAIAPPKLPVTPLRSEASKHGPAQASVAPKSMLDVTKAVLSKTRGGA
jgi:hypothetical protein